MSTFSYAQAAKGQLSTPSAPQSVASQTASTTSNQNPDVTAAVGSTTVPQSIAPSTISSDQDTKEAVPQSSAQPEAVNTSEPATADQPAQENEQAQKSTATESPALPSSERKQSNETSSERRVKGPSARSDVSDNRKSRKGKKSRAADKESEQEQATEKEKEPELPKVQLSDAPIPSVNIWAQRAKDAQSKGVQPAPTRTSAGPSGNASDGKAKPSAGEADNSGRPAANAAKGQKKEFARDANEQASRRHAPRGSRVIEKAAPESLPSVADAASWPTPETAATEIKSQDTVAKPAENEEPQEEKADSGPKDKPKWVAIPFVPSAVFETPLPSRNPRGSKAGAIRGGREGGVRGHAEARNSADRSQAAGAARQAGERSGEAVNGARASSASAPSAKRASVDATNRDVRKVSGTNKEATNGSAPVSGTDESVKTTQSETKDNAAGQQQVSADASSTEKKADSRIDPSRESFTPAVKESGNHHHPTKSEKRSGRGRGGHPGASGQGHHRAHGAYPANGQSYQGPGNMNSRQNSYPGNVSMGYGMSGAGAAPNGHPSRNSTSGAFYRGNGRNGRAPTMPSTPTWNMDPSMQSMSAMPPQPYYYEQSILPMLNRQLSYYFSVNNLLKDSYLRKCMDSQGYVFLDVILGFQRIQQLTADIQIVRMACIECPDIELVTGMEDHRDRIRRVKGWNEFVYPPGSRNENVNFDDGPVNVWRHDRGSMFNPYPMAPPYQVESPGFYPPNGAPFPSYGNEEFQQYNMTNGVNGHSSQKETQLSAAVPEFSPQGGSSASDADQNAALKSSANTNGNEPHTNGLTNGNGVAQPHTNGVAAGADGAGH